MCLAVPGKIISIKNPDELYPRMGKVSFAGIIKEVSLAYVPEAHIGEYVNVHVGFALNRIDEKEAMKVFQYLEDAGDLTQIQDGDA